MLDSFSSNLTSNEVKRAKVLQLLHSHGPMPKIQIATVLEISPATAGALCDELIQQGIVTVAGVGKSAGGRPPTLLQINKSAKYAVGCDVGVTHVATVLTDLNGKVIARIWIDTDSRTEVDKIINAIRSSIHEVINRSGVALANILGIGLSVPGLMDLAKGVSVFAPNLPKWRDVPVVNLIRETFDLPVLMLNDAGAMAMGEHRFGAGQGYRDLVCINIGIGIGAGIILNDRLYRGGAGGCGEVGHVTVNENGPRCPCGSNGCLELMAAGPAIAARAIQAISSGVPTLIESISNSSRTNVSARLVSEAAKQGDKLALEILADAGRYIGIGVAMMVNLLSPSLVILGGGVAYSGDRFFEAVCATVERRAYTTMVNKPAIVISQLGREASVLGAVAMVLEGAFSLADSSLNFFASPRVVNANS